MGETEGGLIDRTPVREAALGRWRGILASFGLDAKTLSGKHCPCPCCGGTDRFRFDDKEGRGTWICSSCGAGDAMALVMLKTGLNFRDAAVKVEELVGTVPASKPKPERSERSKREAMNALWRSAGPVAAGDPVSLYLGRRVGLSAFPMCLRSAPWVRYSSEPLTHFPCMVAMVSDERGNPATLHRTFLTKHGDKAPVEEPRKLMPGGLPLGSSIRLFPPAPIMGVAEGIETAFAAASLFGIPVWSTVVANNMEGWTPPADVGEVIVFCDNDANFRGHAAAYRLAHRLVMRGLRARVEIPATVGQDWNDVLQGGGQISEAA